MYFKEVGGGRTLPPPRQNFFIVFSETRANSKRVIKKNSPTLCKYFSCRGAMFASLYLHNHTSSYNAPYIIVIRAGGTTTFSLTTTPTNAHIKSYKVGFLPTHTIFSFGIWPISPQSFTLMKADIAQMIEHLEANLLLSDSIFPSHSYQKL